LPEALWFESRGQLLLIDHGVVACLGFGRRDVADRLQQPAIVEPVDPGQCRELDGLEAPPRSAAVNDLCLVEAVDRFGESIVVAVTDAVLGSNRCTRSGTAMFEVDFLPVGDGNADAICIQYTADAQGGVFVHVVDGAYSGTGEKIVEHIRTHYGRNFFINHMVLSHADNDHATGLVEVMKRMKVQHLWMNRPWQFAAETVRQFHQGYTVEGLIRRMREMHPYLVDLEREAAKQGTLIHPVFQGDKIGKFTVLAPSPARYISLIPDLEKTPERKTVGGTLGSVFGDALAKVRAILDETWDFETLSNNPDPVSASNETSVVQYAVLEGKGLLLTADVGPQGLNEAAAYAEMLGLKRPSFVQVPHHGSRRNVTPTVLDRWIGGKIGRGSIIGTAYCSVGKAKNDFPRGQVSNAFLRRGY
jgi:beta-lactamase superfamily II metal-dependent hydrolase